MPWNFSVAFSSVHLSAAEEAREKKGEKKGEQRGERVQTERQVRRPSAKAAPRRTMVHPRELAVRFLAFLVVRVFIDAQRTRGVLSRNIRGISS